MYTPAVPVLTETCKCVKVHLIKEINHLFPQLRQNAILPYPCELGPVKIGLQGRPMSKRRIVIVISLYTRGISPL